MMKFLTNKLARRIAVVVVILLCLEVFLDMVLYVTLDKKTAYWTLVWDANLFFIKAGLCVGAFFGLVFIGFEAVKKW